MTREPWRPHRAQQQQLQQEQQQQQQPSVSAGLAVTASAPPATTAAADCPSRTTAPPGTTESCSRDTSMSPQRHAVEPIAAAEAFDQGPTEMASGTGSYPSKPEGLSTPFSTVGPPGRSVSSPIMAEPESPGIGMPSLPPIPSASKVGPLASRATGKVDNAGVPSDNGDIAPRTGGGDGADWRLPTSGDMRREPAVSRPRGGVQSRMMPVKRRRIEAKPPADPGLAPRSNTGLETKKQAPLEHSPRTVGFSPLATKSPIAGAPRDACLPGPGNSTQDHDVADVVNFEVLPQLPTQNGPASDREVLPLDHVMTAVVQATVQVLDQRLKPIADRLDVLSEDIRMSREKVFSNDSVAEMISQQHSDHVDHIDRMRKEIRKLRNEHRVVIGETVAVKEAELKDYFEQTLDRAVGDVVQRCQSAMSNAANAVARTGVEIRMAKETPSPRLLSGQEPRTIAGPPPMCGPQANPRPPPGHSAPLIAAQSRENSANGTPAQLGMDPGHFRPPHAPQSSAAAFHIPVASPEYASGPLIRRAKDARVGADGLKAPAASPSSRRASLPGVPSPKASYDGTTDGALASRILHVVARQVSIWLLGTQHEFDEREWQHLVPSFLLLKPIPVPGISMAQQWWTQETSKLCLKAVADSLSIHKTIEDARLASSLSLGDDDVELSWFLKRPTASTVVRARRNYAAWDPPPSDEEWKVEEYLLHYISNRFHDTLSAYAWKGGETEIGVAIEVSQMAATSDPVVVLNAGVFQGGHGRGSGPFQGHVGTFPSHGSDGSHANVGMHEHLRTSPGGGGRDFAPGAGPGVGNMQMSFQGAAQRPPSGAGRGANDNASLPGRNMFQQR